MSRLPYIPATPTTITHKQEGKSTYHVQIRKKTLKFTVLPHAEVRRKYTECVSFSWPLLEAPLSIFNFRLFLSKRLFENELIKGE
jgi:hypothetical protein